MSVAKPASLTKLKNAEWIPAQILDCARQANGYTLRWESRPTRPDLPA